MEERLDKILVQRALVASRVEAEKMIQEIGVKVNGKLIVKPGKKFLMDCRIELNAAVTTEFAQEGFQLKEAIEKWSLAIKDGVFLDISCREGGYTQALIDHEAARVYALDAKLKTLDQTLKLNEKVVDWSDKSFREVNVKVIGELVDACVVHDENLSLANLLPFIHLLIKPGGFLLAKAKSQLELGKEHLKNNGLVRNSLGFPEMFENLQKLGLQNNLLFEDQIESPTIGKDGQREFLVLFRKIDKQG